MKWCWNVSALGQAKPGEDKSNRLSCCCCCLGCCLSTAYELLLIFTSATCRQVKIQKRRILVPPVSLPLPRFMRPVLCTNVLDLLLLSAPLAPSPVSSSKPLFQPIPDCLAIYSALFHHPLVPMATLIPTQIAPFFYCHFLFQLPRLFKRWQRTSFFYFLSTTHFVTRHLLSSCLWQKIAEGGQAACPRSGIRFGIYWFKSESEKETSQVTLESPLYIHTRIHFGLDTWISFPPSGTMISFRNMAFEERQRAGRFSLKILSWI